jgi:hypothetical protein
MTPERTSQLLEAAKEALRLRAATLAERVGAPKVADESRKFMLRTPDGSTVAIVEWSSAAAPQGAALSAARGQAARAAQGPRLGEPVVVPRLLGSFDGRSANVSPFHPPWSRQRLIGALQKRRAAAAALRWWHEVARATARPAVKAQQLHGEWIEPLRALASETALDRAVRDAALTALALLRNDASFGDAPATALWHGDLWLGNLLPPARGARYPFAVIDWGGSRDAGAPGYDLLRLVGSARLSPVRVAAALRSHAQALRCSPQQVAASALAGLGWLSAHRGAWPFERFAESCTWAVQTLRLAGALPALVHSEDNLMPAR